MVQQLLEASGWTSGSQAGRSALTAPQLVHHVASTIQAELPDLVFNYMALHAAAQEFLEKVKESAHDIGLPHIPHVMTDVADYAGLVLATAAGELEFPSEEGEGILVKVVDLIIEFVCSEFDSKTWKFDKEFVNRCVAHPMTSSSIVGLIESYSCNSCRTAKHFNNGPYSGHGDVVEDDSEDDSDNGSERSVTVTSINLQTGTVIRREQTAIPLRTKDAHSK